MKCQVCSRLILRSDGQCGWAWSHPKAIAEVDTAAQRAEGGMRSEKMRGRCPDCRANGGCFRSTCPCKDCHLTTGPGFRAPLAMTTFGHRHGPTCAH